MTRTRNLSITILVLVTVLSMTALPASAKVPPFTVDVEPAAPMVGEPATVTVTLEEAIPVEHLPELMAFFREGDSAADAEGVAVDLERTGDTVYTAAIVFPRPGRWHVVPFPGSLTPGSVPTPFLRLSSVEVTGGESGNHQTALAIGAVVGAAVVIAGWRQAGRMRSVARPRRMTRS